MARFQSAKYVSRRTERRVSLRRFIAVLITTGLVASGGLGAFPRNPVTTTFQQVARENIPEAILAPVNSYFDELSISIFGSQPTPAQNPSLDLVGLILGDGIVSPSPTFPVVETPTPTSAPTSVASASPTLTATPTRTVTPTSSPTAQLTSTSTPTATANCLPPSSTPATVTFFNSSGQTIQVYLVDPACKLILYATLGPEESFVQQTFIRQRWWFVDSPTQKVLADYVVSSALESVDVSTGKVTAITPTPTPFGGLTVSNVVLTDDLYEFGTSITLVPNQEFYVTYNFQVSSSSCPTCGVQLVTGLSSTGDAAEACAYAGVPGGTPGASGTESATLIAPSSPGTYSVVVEYHQKASCADALINFGSGAAFFKQVIGQIIVQSGSS